jgi:hypothetical protein
LEETIKALINRIVAENEVFLLSKRKSPSGQKCKAQNACAALLSKTNKK